MMRRPVVQGAVFGRDLRTVLPHLEVSQPRVNGVQVRQYEGVRLKEVAPEDSNGPITTPF